MRSGVLVDSNVLIHHLAGDLKAKKIVDSVEGGVFEGYINQIIISEVIFVFLKLSTKMNVYHLKKKPDIIRRTNLDKVYDLLGLFDELPSHRDITVMAKEIMHTYGLLPNDALIAATCRHYGIRRLATFDSDFERVDFLEIVRP
ncbi:MAG: PIN domain-containing protein [Euryarchaeota archaeon]|nr:PIN domain-containing protein [Euryarchaeota archaeon]